MLWLEGFKLLKPEGSLGMHKSPQKNANLMAAAELLKLLNILAKESGAI